MIDGSSNTNCRTIEEKGDLISIYRDSIMGLAILWVIFLHSGIDFGKTGFISYFISFIKYTGYLGVDIFFFVSGFGLMVGRCKKKYTVCSFYKRRFKRIMPMYWFFLSLSLILFGTTKNLSSIFIDYTGFGFLIFNNGHWFISAILLCYLIFPIFANSMEKSENKLRFIAVIVIACLSLAIIITTSAFLFANKFSYLLILILRLPAFFMGGLIGYIYVKGYASLNYLFSIHFHIIFIFFCYVALAFIYSFSSSGIRTLYGLYWYPFMLGSFSLTFLFSIFFDTFIKYFGFLLNISAKIGESSLELYFIHFLIFDQIPKIHLTFSYFNISIRGNYLWLVAIFTSVLLAIVFNWVWSHSILNQYQKDIPFKNLSQ
jgi:peptidoglycan/LPS O-acetylase OafA/YrhL